MNSSMIFTIATVVALPLVGVAASRPTVFLQIAWLPASIFIAMAGCSAWMHLTSLHIEAEMTVRDLVAPVPAEAREFFEQASKAAYEQLRRSREADKELGLLSAALLGSLLVAVLAASIARRHDAEDKPVPAVPALARCEASVPAVPLPEASNFIAGVRRRRRRKEHLIAALNAARAAKARNNAIN